MVDRIGKGGAVPPPAPEEPTPKGAVGKAFEVERAAQPAPVGATHAAAGTSPLARLRSGEIDLHAYLDLKVDEATAGLTGVPPAELDAIKKTLRDQMATDPGLADLVRGATGRAPEPPTEE
jgi:hypothetical protein